MRDVSFARATNVQAILYRLHPLDVGFDLRGGMRVKIDPSDAFIRVSYADERGERRVLEGQRAAVIARLAQLGYEVV